MTNSERKIISGLLLHSSHNGKLEKGIVQEVASSFSVSNSVIYRIWRQLCETGDACHKKTKNCGRKRVEIDYEKMREISLAKHRNLLSLSRALALARHHYLDM